MFVVVNFYVFQVANHSNNFLDHFQPGFPVIPTTVTKGGKLTRSVEHQLNELSSFLLQKR